MSAVVSRPARRPLLIDKNILQGWPADEVAQLGCEYELLMPDVLFFELMSTDDVARARCFRKLPQTENPIVLVDHIGPHLQHEVVHHRPMGRPSQHPLLGRFKFNTALCDIDAGWSPSVRATVEQQVDSLKARVAGLVGLALTISKLTPGPNDKDVRSDFAWLERKVTDLDWVRAFVDEVIAPHYPEKLPAASQMDETWALIRHTQVKLMLAIDLWRRFGESLNQPLTPKRYRLIEHDVLDADYLGLALLEGAFATDEAKLGRMFMALRPDGLLVSRNRLT